MPGLTVAVVSARAFSSATVDRALAGALQDAGHRVVFVTDGLGPPVADGFEELSVGGVEPRLEELWTPAVQSASGAPAIEQLASVVRPVWQALARAALADDEELAGALDELGPDVVVHDGAVCRPALEASGRPWVRVMAGSPTEVPDPMVPPRFSGYSAGNRDGWEEFRAEHRRTNLDVWQAFAEGAARAGAPLLPELAMINESEWLNLWVVPAALDLPRAVPLGPTWHRVEVGAPATPDRAEPGPGVLERSPASRRVYVRLPEMAAMAPGNAERVGAALAEGGHCGTDTLAGADVAVVDGSADAVRAVVAAGCPAVVLPTAWDQLALAQRLHETSGAVTWRVGGGEIGDLLGAVERQAGAAPAQLAMGSGAVDAARLIEAVGRTAAPVRRAGAAPW